MDIKRRALKNFDKAIKKIGLPPKYPVNLNLMHQNHFIPVKVQTKRTKELKVYNPNDKFSIEKISDDKINKTSTVMDEVFNASQYPLPNWTDKKLLTILIAEAFRDGDNPKREVTLDVRYIAEQLGHESGLDPTQLSHLRDRYAESINRWRACSLKFKNWYHHGTGKRGKVEFSIIDMVFRPHHSTEITVSFSPKFMDTCQDQYRILVDTKHSLEHSSGIASRVYDIILSFNRKWGVYDSKSNTYMDFNVKVERGEIWKIKEITLIEKIWDNVAFSSSLRLHEKRKELRKGIEESCNKLKLKSLLEDGVYSFYVIE